MTDEPDLPLTGMRVIELAMYAFAPACGAVLAEWGADVIKVSHPWFADPMRGIPVQGLPPRDDGVSFMWEQLNRSKRSMTIDISIESGRGLLDELLSSADVFLTNLLPTSRARLGIEPADLHAVNPRLVYARATGHGAQGPDRDKGAFDHTSFWCRSGIGHAASVTADEFQTLIGPAFGDLTSGMALAGGVAAALLRRERTGRGAVVDGSLLATGMWVFSPAIVAAGLYGVDTLPRPRHAEASHALVAGYLTADDRVVYLAGVRTDQHWGNLCDVLGADELRNDPRFDTGPARVANSAALVAHLDTIFAAKTLAEWEPRLAELDTPWSIVRTALEVHSDPQVEANQLLVDLEGDGRPRTRVVAAPIRFDQQRATPITPAPEHGADTEAILLELGHGWDEILALRDSGAI